MRLLAMSDVERRRKQREYEAMLREDKEREERKKKEARERMRQKQDMDRARILEMAASKQKERRDFDQKAIEAKQDAYIKELERQKRIEYRIFNNLPPDPEDELPIES
jgi:ribosomal protein L16/L10AE